VSKILDELHALTDQLRAEGHHLARDFVTFVISKQNEPVTVFAIPTALNPIIQQTSTP
jgi:hypothetical protein